MPQPLVSYGNTLKFNIFKPQTFVPKPQSYGATIKFTIVKSQIIVPQPQSYGDTKKKRLLFHNTQVMATGILSGIMPQLQSYGNTHNQGLSSEAGSSHQNHADPHLQMESSPAYTDG